MKIIKIFILPLISLSLIPYLAYASGGGGGSYGGGSYSRPSYKKPTPRKSPRSSNRSSYSSTPSRAKPSSLSLRGIRQRVDKSRRGKGISVHDLYLSEGSFILKGNYRDPSTFAEFLRNLRAGRKERDQLNLETIKRSSAGETDYDFIIRGRNRWQ